jgi:hypothetical protein
LKKGYITMFSRCICFHSSPRKEFGPFLRMIGLFGNQSIFPDLLSVQLRRKKQDI